MRLDFRRLRREVLGLNRRNLDLLQRHNEQRLYTIADDKIATKEALAAAGLPVPPTYAVCGRATRRRTFREALGRRDDFVLKPARGGGGEGILVIRGRDGDRYLTAGGRRLRLSHLLAHTADILSGAYAVSQTHDDALLETRLRAAPELADISPGGAADLRVVVFRGVPVIAMLRLPTRRGRGRANLHAGGIGVGVDLTGGRTVHAIRNGRSIDRHPDSGEPLIGRQIGAWDDLLLLAASCYEAVPLGYFGADIIVDAALGAVVLELNARPGLAVQLAARRGLRPALEAIAALDRVEERGTNERVALGQAVSAVSSRRSAAAD